MVYLLLHGGQRTREGRPMTIHPHRETPRAPLPSRKSRSRNSPFAVVAVAVMLTIGLIAFQTKDRSFPRMSRPRGKAIPHPRSRQSRTPNSKSKTKHPGTDAIPTGCSGAAPRTVTPVASRDAAAGPHCWSWLRLKTMETWNRSIALCVGAVCAPAPYSRSSYLLSPRSFLCTAWSSHLRWIAAFPSRDIGGRSRINLPILTRKRSPRWSNPTSRPPQESARGPAS